MKILVIGGAGTIGTAIVEASARAGFEVYSVTRHQRIWGNEHIHPICADWWNDKEAHAVLDKQMFDVIFDGLIFSVRGLRRNMELVEGHCKQYVYVSSDGVYNRPAENVREDTPIDIDKISWDIMLDKRKIELFLLENRNKYTYMTTIIRPTLTYGDVRIPLAIVSRKNQWTVPSRIFHDKPIICIEDNRSLHGITPACIFGDAVIGTFMNKKSNGEAYHISLRKGYCWDDIARIIGNLLGHDTKIIHVPIEWIQPFNEKLYIEVKYDKLETLTMDISKIESISPSVNYDADIRESLEKTVIHLQQEKSSEPLDHDFETMCDYLVLKYIKEGTSIEEKRICENYAARLSDEQKKRIQADTRRLIWNQRKSKVYEIVRTAFRNIMIFVLPDTVVAAIRACRKKYGTTG